MDLTIATNKLEVKFSLILFNIYLYELNFNFKALSTKQNSIQRGCRISPCSSDGCTSCSTRLCNTSTGALNTSGFTLTGFFVLVGAYKLF